MIFYTIHNLINNINYTKEWNESKKNCFTFIIGATLYAILYVIFEYLSRSSGRLVFQMINKFFLYFVIIDVITMAVIYKLYWGRSILNETIPNEDVEWEFDKEEHKYKKT